MSARSKAYHINVVNGTDSLVIRQNGTANGGGWRRYQMKDIVIMGSRISIFGYFQRQFQWSWDMVFNTKVSCFVFTLNTAFRRHWNWRCRNRPALAASWFCEIFMTTVWFWCGHQRRFMVILVLRIDVFKLRDKKVIKKKKYKNHLKILHKYSQKRFVLFYLPLGGPVVDWLARPSHSAQVV